MSSEVREVESALLSIETALENRFDDLQDTREKGGEDYGVFVLEHGFSLLEIENLNHLYRDHLRLGGIPTKYPLCACVYFAEIGFVYTANSEGEYWPLVQESTPHPVFGGHRYEWHDGGGRARNMVRELFKEFATRFNGVEPQGRFAESSGIISWPITHAVLSKDLRIHLARALYYCVDQWISGTSSDEAAEDICEYAERYFGSKHRFTQFANQTSVVAQIIGSLLTFEESDQSENDVANRYISSEVVLRVLEDMEKTASSRSEITFARQRFKAKVGGFGKRTTTWDSSSGESGKGISQKTARRRFSRSSNSPAASIQAELNVSANEWNFHYHLPALRNIGLQDPRLGAKLRTSQIGIKSSDETFLNSISRSHLRFLVSKQIGLFRGGSPKLISPSGLSEEELREISLRTRDHEFEAPIPWLFRLSEETGVGRLTNSFSIGSDYLLLVDVKDVDLISDLRTHAEQVKTSIKDDSISAFRFLLNDLDFDFFEDILARLGFLHSLRVDIFPVIVVPQNSDVEGGIWLEGDVVTLAFQSKINEVEAQITCGDLVLEKTIENSSLVVSFKELAVGPHVLSYKLSHEKRTLIGEYEIRVIPRNLASTELAESPVSFSSSCIDLELDDLLSGAETLWIDGPMGGVAKISLDLQNFFSGTSTQIEISKLEGGFSFPVSGIDLGESLAQCVESALDFKRIYGTATNAKICVSNDFLNPSNYEFELALFNRKIILSIDEELNVEVQTTEALKPLLKLFTIDDWVLPLTSDELPKVSENIWRIPKTIKAQLVFATAGDEIATHFYMPSRVQGDPFDHMTASLIQDEGAFKIRTRSLRAIITEQVKNDQFPRHIAAVAGRLFRESIADELGIGVAYRKGDRLTLWTQSDLSWEKFEQGMRVFRLHSPLSQLSDREFAVAFSGFLSGISTHSWLSQSGVTNWMHSNRVEIGRIVQMASVKDI